eukprot:9786401-Lingulodinium_polyedra.AAC.1
MDGLRGAARGQTRPGLRAQNKRARMAFATGLACACEKTAAAGEHAAGRPPSRPVVAGCCPWRALRG